MGKLSPQAARWTVRLLCVSVLAVLLAVWSRPPAALSAPATPKTEKPAVVKVTVIEGTQIFPFYAMETKGIADKYHLKIKETKVTGPQAQYTVIQTGDFQVTLSAWLAVALLRAHGYKVIETFPVISYTNDVLVPKDSPLKNFADLKGKRVGIFSGLNSGVTWLFRLECVRYFGFDPLKVSKVQFGAPPLLAGMLEKHQLDAILILDPFITRLLVTGKYRSIGNLGEIWKEKTGQDAMLLAVTMNESWAKAHRDVARRFVAAYKESLVYLKTHKSIWPALARSVGIKTAKGAELLRERTAGSMLTKWNKKFIDEQYQFAASVIKVFGKTKQFPRRIPRGLFDLHYAP